jgi:DNA adenine methylase
MRLSDLCAPLIQMYRSVIVNPDRVYAELREIAARGVDEDAYYEERRKAMTPGRFLYLNALSFNGVYRENSSGRYNVPYGDRGEDPFQTREEIHAVSAALRGAQIQSQDFRRALRSDLVGEGDLVFVDSPYHGGFSGYTKTGFSDDDHQALAGILEGLATNGAHIVACNADTPGVRSWYSWVPHVVETGERRAVNRDGVARSKKAACLIFTTDLSLLGDLGA